MIPGKTEEQYNEVLDAAKFLKEKQEEHFEKHGVNFDTDRSIAVVMQEFAEQFHNKKTETRVPDEILTEEEVKEDFKYYLTVGRLKEMIEEYKIPDEANVLTQRVEDVYYKKHGWGVILKEGDHYHSVISMNEKMIDEIARRERGEEPYYPQIKDPNDYIRENKKHLNEMKEQYTPVFCVAGYKDSGFLFLNLHY
jgi:hypothetical protein